MSSFINSFLFHLFYILYCKLYGSHSSWKKTYEIQRNTWNLITYYFKLFFCWFKNEPSFIHSKYLLFLLKIFCIVINVILQYTRSTNYFWMFNESFYLHLLLLTVFKEQNSLNRYYFIGWGKFQHFFLRYKNIKVYIGYI